MRTFMLCIVGMFMVFCVAVTPAHAELEHGYFANGSEYYTDQITLDSNSEGIVRVIFINEIELNKNGILLISDSMDTDEFPMAIEVYHKGPGSPIVDSVLFTSRDSDKLTLDNGYSYIQTVYIYNGELDWYTVDAAMAYGNDATEFYLIYADGSEKRWHLTDSEIRTWKTVMGQ